MKERPQKVRDREKRDKYIKKIQKRSEREGKRYEEIKKIKLFLRFSFIYKVRRA